MRRRARLQDPLQTQLEQEDGTKAKLLFCYQSDWQQRLLDKTTHGDECPKTTHGDQRDGLHKNNKGYIKVTGVLEVASLIDKIKSTKYTWDDIKALVEEVKKQALNLLESECRNLTAKKNDFILRKTSIQGMENFSFDTLFKQT
ncbi:hypothetical protein Bbelb_278150 [Branchiostoma belcheri]|nr:hypothetical protein Bbelb_278150 [Branchiostoma belcheri]